MLTIIEYTDFFCPYCEWLSGIEDARKVSNDVRSFIALAPESLHPTALGSTGS